MAEKILKSKIRTKRGLVGYENNLLKDIDQIYATYAIGKLDLLSSYKDYKDIIEDKLVKNMNLWEEINDNIEDEEDLIFVETLLNSLHVDYVNARASSVEVGYEFYLKAKRTFAEGGFNLRKFRSNSREFNPFLANVPILYWCFLGE